MNINFNMLPADVQLRLIRARAQELCDADPIFREMMDCWTDGVNRHGVHVVQQVTTRVIPVKGY